MSPSILPSAEEVERLLPGPDSILWRYGGDARIMATSGYALLLQVAHPVVAGGVRDHSDFAGDPWGRLLRTLDYVYVMSYGGRDAATATARRLREMHTTIKGTDAQGRRYHALEPEAWTWVHATLLSGMVLGHRRFGRPLRTDQVERLYCEWRALGRVIGVRARDLPDDWAGYREYFDRTVAEVLEDNDVVREVFAVLNRPVAPPLPWLSDPFWRLATLPVTRLMSLATTGLLPPVMRERLGLSWSWAQELELRALGAASSAATPIMPSRLRNVGPGYLRWRAQAIARGESVATTGAGAKRAPAAA